MSAHPLIQHALQNAWCDPYQDRQVHLRLARITPAQGAYKDHTVLWRNIDLPNTTQRWHLFQIGNVFPSTFKLNTPLGAWVSFSQQMVNSQTIVVIYSANGRMLPRYSGYFQYTPDRNLIVALPDHDLVQPNVKTDTIYLRLYSNAYFGSSRNTQGDAISIQSAYCTTAAQVASFQSALASQTFFSQPVVDGFLVKDFSQLTTGQHADLLVDPSIVKTVDFKIGDLQPYVSSLDNLSKYILHYSGVDQQTIDFVDDIDVYVIDKISPTQERGLYYYRHTPAALRNLTHRDYGIAVMAVQYLANLLVDLRRPDISSVQDIYLRLYIRRSGFQRPLILENSRIQDLYQLDSVSIQRALSGLDSTVPYWQAAALEANAYTSLMRASLSEITLDRVREAYGYHACSRILGENPVKTSPIGTLMAANVPYAFQSGAQVYEYDVNGLLTGTLYHAVGEQFYCQRQDTALVEFIYGIGEPFTEDLYTADLSFAVPGSDSHRVYVCAIVNGHPDYQWTDVSQDSRLTQAAGMYHWNGTGFTPYFLIRRNTSFLDKAYNLDAYHDQGLEIIVDYLAKVEYVYRSVMNTVPYGQLAVFLNGYSLIQGLDYQVSWPRIMITNKSYLSNAYNQLQTIRIRASGFCTASMQWDNVETEQGFIQHGMLSNNNRYDIHQDRVTRIIQKGALIHRSDLVYSETTPGVSITNSMNGDPYQITDSIVPMSQVLGMNTYTARAQSQVIDQVISDYMTLKLPQPTRAAPSVVAQKHHLYSPFINRIVTELLKLNLVIADLPSPYSDEQVMAHCAPYTYLIAFDPIHRPETIDQQYLSVEPHASSSVVALSYPQYQFISRVIQLYGNNLTQASGYFTLST